jgi:hypothetical protein
MHEQAVAAMDRVNAIEPWPNISETTFTFKRKPPSLAAGNSRESYEAG